MYENINRNISLERKTLYIVVIFANIVILGSQFVEIQPPAYISFSRQFIWTLISKLKNQYASVYILPKIIYYITYLTTVCTQLTRCSKKIPTYNNGYDCKSGDIKQYSNQKSRHELHKRSIYLSIYLYIFFYNKFINSKLFKILH
jgi:hypothetical protein